MRIYLDVAFASSIVAAIMAALYVIFAPPPYDRFPYLLANDFVNAWVGARAALTGDPTPWFDLVRFNAELQSLFGPDYPLHIWSYPPHLLLFTWPLGLLALLPAYLFWCVATLAAYAAVIVRTETRPVYILLPLVAPAVAVNLYLGQNGFITSALLIGGLLCLDRRPLLAGVLFGLLSIKPQLGILIPVMLVLTRRWQTIAAAGGTIAVLAGATALVFGPKVWTAYVDVAWPVQSRIVADGYAFFMAMMPTPFMNLRAAGLPVSSAGAVQAIASLLALAAVVWTFCRRRDPDLSNALLVTATFLATPYAFNYDMVVFGWVLGLMLKRADNAAADYALMLAVWMTPALVYILGIVELPCSSLIVAAFAARLLWKLARPERARIGAPHTVLTAANA